MNAIIRQSLYTPNELMYRVVTTYLISKGKQVRPIMVILSAGIFGNVNSHVLHAGAALEMLHNASLIHDDVVDETSLRRGRATINSEWGNHIAVLVGDYFVSNALAAGIRTNNISIISALSDLGKELSLGEIDQICNARNHHFDEESYFSMIRQKTASLFVNCVRMGAEAAGAKPEEYAPLLEFAELFGLCFQIKDDIFDYSESREIGKPTGNDMVEGKLTLPALHVLNTVKDKTAEEIAVKIKNGEATPGEIAHLIEFTKQHGGIEYASQVMYDYKEKALSLLVSLPDTEVKAALAAYLDYVVEREK